MILQEDRYIWSFNFHPREVSLITMMWQQELNKQEDVEIYGSLERYSGSCDSFNLADGACWSRASSFCLSSSLSIWHKIWPGQLLSLGMSLSLLLLNLFYLAFCLCLCRMVWGALCQGLYPSSFEQKQSFKLYISSRKDWQFKMFRLFFMIGNGWVRALRITSSTAQGGGGSFKNRKRIGEIDCCEWRMSEQKHWPTD